MSGMSKAEATALLQRAYDKHQLHDWTVGFDSARRMAGRCWYNKRMITLSTYVMARRTPEETFNTILHELAHALAWVAYRENGHGPMWRKIHIALGGDGKRCFEFKDNDAPWLGDCECGEATDVAKYKAPGAGRRYYFRHNGRKCEVKFRRNV